MISWLENNKEWVFSGIGVSVLGILVFLVKGFLPRDKAGSREMLVSQNPSVSQAPTVNTSPVFNITNTVAPAGDPRPAVEVKPQTSQAPFFALTPRILTRDLAVLVTVIGASGDDALEGCIARFKMHDQMAGCVPDRFEVSIHYIERGSASGMPFQLDAGYVNQAGWLTQDNRESELILIVRKNALFYAVSGEKAQGFSSSDSSLIPVNLFNDSLLAAVRFTDTTDGQRWRIDYAIGLSDAGELTVREANGLRRS